MRRAFSVDINYKICYNISRESEEKMEDLMNATSLFDVLNEFKDKENFEKLRDIVISNLPADAKVEMEGIIRGELLPSLTSDVVAKKIFSPSEHPERVAWLLSKITLDNSISIDGDMSNEGYSQSTSAKKMIFDIPVRLLDKRRADIEFQVAAQDFIIERAELYSSDLLLVEYSAAVNQKKGDLDFTDVHGTIVIVFMRKSPEPFASFKSNRYIHRFDTMASDSGLVHNPLRKMYFVQLDKAMEQLLEGIDAEGDYDFQLLLAMMADINNQVVKEKIAEHPDLKEIYQEVSLYSQSKEVQNMLLAEKYAVADFNAVKSYERKEERKQTIYKLVSSGELSIDAGAKYLGISVDDLKNQMLVCGFSVPETK